MIGEPLDEGDLLRNQFIHNGVEDGRAFLATNSKPVILAAITSFRETRSIRSTHSTRILEMKNPHGFDAFALPFDQLQHVRGFIGVEV